MFRLFDARTLLLLARDRLPFTTSGLIIRARLALRFVPDVLPDTIRLLRGILASSW